MFFSVVEGKYTKFESLFNEKPHEEHLASLTYAFCLPDNPKIIKGNAAAQIQMKWSPSSSKLLYTKLIKDRVTVTNAYTLEKPMSFWLFLVIPIIMVMIGISSITNVLKAAIKRKIAIPSTIPLPLLASTGVIVANPQIRVRKYFL